MPDKHLSFAFIFILLFGCVSDRENIAIDKTFYFSVASPSNSSDELVAYLIENLNNKRVAITNQSGQIWPFYKIIDPNIDLPLDSLMPPHSFVHLLKLKGENEIRDGEYFVDIKVMMLTDTLPNYELKIYKMNPEGLAFSADSGIHFIEDSSAHDRHFLYDIFIKSIIRYSFK